MRILVCGSRDWKDDKRIAVEITRIAPETIVHGACPTGADAFAGEFGHFAHLRVDTYPVNIDIDGEWPSAGPRRNGRMLRKGEPDRGLAFGALWRPGRRTRQLGILTPSGLYVHTGTGDMVKRMIRAGLPVRWIATPDAEAVDLTSMPGPPA